MKQTVEHCINFELDYEDPNAGHMRPAKHMYVARELQLKLFKYPKIKIKASESLLNHKNDFKMKILI